MFKRILSHLFAMAFVVAVYPLTRELGGGEELATWLSVIFGVLWIQSFLFSDVPSDVPVHGEEPGWTEAAPGLPVPGKVLYEGAEGMGRGRVGDGRRDG